MTACSSSTVTTTETTAEAAEETTATEEETTAAAEEETEAETADETAEEGDTAAEAAEDTSAEASGTVEVQFDTAVVDVEGGKLRGYIDDGIYTYKGIHYATAERFEEPQKVAAWEGIKDAMVYGDMAPQVDMTAGAAEMINPHFFWPMATDETQIQTLNIWSPDINSSEKKAVMVWIHGGGYSTGASTEQIAYDGHNLAEYGDIVVVSVNHRLNCLGYLDLSAYGYRYKHSGNLGQLDLVAALEWIYDNIEQFGGDPENVTIFGQSGGGGKVLNLMGTPSAEGLFEKVICMSGGGSTNTQEDAQAVAALTLEKLGLTEDTVREIETIDYDTLSAAANEACDELDYSWGPVVDGDFMPKNIWEDGNLTDEGNDIPLMIGTVFSEFTSNAFDYSTGEEVDKNALTDDEVDEILTEKYGDSKNSVVAAFKSAYPEKDIIDVAYLESSFRGLAIDVAEKKAAQGGAPVYNYLFALEIPTMGGWLSWHCADIPFAFHNIELVKTTFSLEPQILAMQEAYCSAYVNFAKTGDPNNENLPEWPAYTEEGGETMILDEESFVGYHHDDALMTLLTNNAE